MINYTEEMFYQDMWELLNTVDDKEFDKLFETKWNQVLKKELECVQPTKK